jgi:hypothetical protein
MQSRGGGVISCGIIKGRFKRGQAAQLFFAAQGRVIGNVIGGAHKAIKAQHLRADFRRQQPGRNREILRPRVSRWRAGGGALTCHAAPLAE